eukprot:scaffold32466_cov29-Cyclotella_meneghiniana.AAC.1
MVDSRILCPARCIGGDAHPGLTSAALKAWGITMLIPPHIHNGYQHLHQLIQGGYCSLRIVGGCAGAPAPAFSNVLWPNLRAVTTL